MMLFVLLFALAVRGGDGSPSAMPDQSYDTIIVGLGSAGSTAASTLCKAGRRVLALEAQNRIGGRVHTVPFGDGVVEVGAEWIHGTHPSRVYDLAIANNVTVLPQDLNFEVFRSDGSTADKAMVNDLMTFGLAVVDEPPEKPEPLGQYITKRLMEYIERKYPQLLADKDFIDEFLKFMDLLIDNYEASNSWNDVSTQTNYQELEGHQHTSWHRYGYKTFFEILLNTYNGGPGFPNLDIKLNTEVTQISWPQDPTADVIVTCKDGATYRARNVIVTVSLGVLKERHANLFSPALPAEKIRSIDIIPMGVIGKIILSFPHHWWTMNKTINYNYLWTTKDIKQLESRDWTVSLIGTSTPMGGDNILTLWTSGETTKLTMFSPQLPQDKITVIEKLCIGVVAKIITSYQQPWWNAKRDFFGFVWKGADRRALGKGDTWLTKTDGVTTPMGSNNTLTLWWSGDDAKLVSTRNNMKLTQHTTLFSPKLPIDKVTSIEKVSIGVMDKIILSFSEAWWPLCDTFFAFIWTGADRKCIDKGDEWTTQIFGASRPLGSGNALTLWMSGDNAKLVETLPEDEVKRKVLGVLRRFMGKDVNIPEPTGIIRSTWHSNPYTRGSYTYDSLLVTQYPNARSTLAAPLVDSSGKPRVLFAGEATDTTHFSTVHGASDSGYRVANRLLPQAKL